MPTEWIMGLVGGVIIGLAAAMYLLVNGRIMGASGILGGLVDGSAKETSSERASFIVGLVAVPAVVAMLMGGSDTHLNDNLAIVALAGILVGVGTRLANGCTSGHGVCGISRFSLRGIVATVFYIGAGGLTVVFARHILGLV